MLCHLPIPQQNQIRTSPSEQRRPKRREPSICQHLQCAGRTLDLADWTNLAVGHARGQHRHLAARMKFDNNIAAVRKFDRAVRGCR
ncbi:hypothetical protein AWL63_13440 [Sphingomonas panacis]|uniref:Uncharacterized protein n=1 Tax=Sphingomonas panacis TaxID=1560345 RepID=A0A1B3ZBL7_9SPHN|nr:hypothetical protein AWL63_13440 [Sphingomonas panacis]